MLSLCYLKGKGHELTEQNDKTMALYYSRRERSALFIFGDKGCKGHEESKLSTCEISSEVMIGLRTFVCTKASGMDNVLV